MEMETLNALMGRLEAAAAALEASAGKMEAPAAGEVQRITAAVDGGVEAQSERELALEKRLAEAEQAIASLRAQGSSHGEKSARGEAIRKTLPPSTVQLLAKQGLESLGAMEMTSVDAALAGLGIEQRMAVKAQLIRAGALTV